MAACRGISLPTSIYDCAPPGRNDLQSGFDVSQVSESRPWAPGPSLFGTRKRMVEGCGFPCPQMRGTWGTLICYLWDLGHTPTLPLLLAGAGSALTASLVSR